MKRIRIAVLLAMGGLVSACAAPTVPGKSAPFEATPLSSTSAPAEQATNADARGQTQKVRITDHLAEVIRQELTTAEGFANPRLGFIQAMNNQQK